MKYKNYPLSRKDNIVIQEFDNEILIYDLFINKAFCLNQTSAMVWQECDGTKSVKEISHIITKKLKLDINEDVVWLALNQLKSDFLLEDSFGFETPLDGLSRREAVKQIGFASLVVLPIISTLVAPTSLLAQSGLSCPPFNAGTNDAAPGCPCQGNNDCCAVCGGNAANPICGGNVKPNAPAICSGIVCPPFNAGTNDAAPGCPCQGNNDCCAVCGGNAANPICGGTVKPNAPPNC